jgi:hypothetical protein
VAFRDVTPERMRRPLSVLVVNWRNISITLICLLGGDLSEMAWLRKLWEDCRSGTVTYA